MGESGLHMSWTAVWGYLLSLPRPLQESMAKKLDAEMVAFLPFRQREVQIEILSKAPQALIDSLARRKARYNKPGDGVGYLPIILPEVLEYLNAERGIKTESRKSKRKECHHK